MNFLNIKFPEKISFISEGGPSFSTNITSSSAGIEFRNQKYIKPFSKYIVNLSKINDSMKNELISFFYIVKGRFYSFRFKDFLDFEAKTNKNDEINQKNFVLIGENEDFDGEKWKQVLELQKVYYFSQDLMQNFYCDSLNQDETRNLSDLYYVRKITKPIKSSLKFWENKTPKEIEGFKLDEKTGKLYFREEQDLERLDLSFEFDVCVRFGSDFLQISNSNPGIFNSEKIELFEVFE